MCLCYRDYFGSWPVLVTLRGVQGFTHYLNSSFHLHKQSWRGNSPMSRMQHWFNPHKQKLWSSQTPRGHGEDCREEGNFFLSRPAPLQPPPLRCFPLTCLRWASSWWKISNGKSTKRSDLRFFIRLNCCFLANPTGACRNAYVWAAIFHCWGQNWVYAIFPSTSFNVWMSWL